MTDRPTRQQVEARSAANRAAWSDVGERNRPPTPQKRAGGALKREIGPSEHAIQVALIEFWNLWAPTKGLDPRLLMAIPNAGAGGSKGQAGKMKAEGSRAGVPDLFLALPMISSGHYIFAGLWLELKAARGRLTVPQRSMIELLRRDYNVVVAYGLDEAQRALTAYVSRAMR